MTFTSTNLLDCLPEWYREVFDYQEICDAEQSVLDAAQSSMKQVLDNFFMLRMDLATTEMWEKVLEIRPDNTAETLDFRRRRVLNRLSLKSIYTLAYLMLKLDELVGQDKWKCEITPADYLLEISCDYDAISSAPTEAELNWTVNHIKPAHISYTLYSVAETKMSLDIVRMNAGLGYATTTTSLPKLERSISYDSTLRSGSALYSIMETPFNGIQGGSTE